MTSLFADRVQESSTFAGTGAIALSGATLPSMNTFGSVFADGALVGYVVLNQAVQTEWEKGIGTYVAGSNSIARTYVTGGSNGTSPVNFSAGTKLVMSVAPQTQTAQAYSSTQVYAPGDTAQSGGSTWYALAVNIGSAPSASNANWTTLGGTGTQGPPGPAATIAVGTTTTLAPGSSASVSNSGTSSDATFNFGIPAGATGAQGPTGTVTPDYISGLRLSYVDATHVQVGTGAASRQSDGSLITLSTAVSVNILSGGSQFWHLYLTSSGTPNVVASTTSPTAPYFGTARSGSTTTQRYVGSVLMNGESIVPFTMLGAKIRYLTAPSASPFRALSGGSATTSTNINLSGVLPATARIAHTRLLMGTGGQAYIGNSDMGVATSSNYMTTARPSSEFESELLTDSSQAINYTLNSSGSLTIDVNGYEFER